MKTCKKIALMAMMVIIAVIATTTNVYAGLAEIFVTTTQQEVSVGDEVTVVLKAKCGLGIEGIDSTLEYDNTKLKLVTAVGSAAANGYADFSGIDELTGEYKLSILYNMNGAAPTEADFAILKFEVLEAAQVNENLTIKLSNIEFGDSTDEWGTLEDSQLTIKVVEKKQEPPVDEDCTHTYEMTSDETHHWEECTKCKEEKEGTKELHKYGECKDKGDGTHYSTCTICNHTLVEKHNFVDEKCEDCGVAEIKDDESNNNNNNNDNDNDNDNNNNNNNNNNNSNNNGNTSTGGNKDNTTSGNDIPKAGLNPMLVTVLSAVAIVSVVMYLKNKKYQDII